MKLNSILILPIFFLLASCSKQKETSGTLSLLSYNIAGLPEGISQSRPSKNTSLIGELINEIQIVQVQEDFNYHGLLNNNALHSYKTKWSGPAGAGDGLNTLSDFPIHDIDRQKWRNCNGADCFTPKGFYYSKIEISKGVFVDFYNVHANAGDEPADFAARRQNIIQLANYIKEVSEGNAVVLMGDFNSRFTREGDILNKLTEIGLKDVWIELIREGNHPLPENGYLRDCSDRSGYNCDIVDKVFFRNSAKLTFTPIKYVVDDERYYKDGDNLSDHEPVFVKIEYNCLP